MLSTSQLTLFTLAGLLAVASAPACIESPQEMVDYESVAVPTGARTATAGDWTIELTRADVALGPFYFCAAASGSSTLCESSIAELRTVTRVDGLVGAPEPLGRVHGFTGVIKSAAYDLGISWFDTQVSATPSAVTPAGHSAHIEGVATKGALRIPFVANVDVVPQYQGQNAVPTSRADANVTSNRTRLEIHLDPIAWTKQLDFDAIAATGKIPFTIEPGSQEHNALLVGIKNLAPPELRWISLP